MILNARRMRGCATSQTTLLAIALLTFMGAGALWSASGRIPRHTKAAEMKQALVAPAGVPEGLKARAQAMSVRLPLAFEANRGQVDKSVAYMAHGSGYGLFLTAKEAVLTLQGAAKQGTAKQGLGASAAVRMRLEGSAEQPEVAGTDPLPGKSDYFIGNDPSRWVRNVPQFARVRYSAVYPGVDLVYYGKQGQLEYDFVVASGAEPRQIRMNVAGAENVSVTADGSLRVKTAVRELRWNKPVAYQEVDGRRREVSGRFELLAKNRVGFALGAYDRGRELVIDPSLSYATYFGGTGAEINPQVAVDPNSSVYIAGTTSSPGSSFPINPSQVTTPPTLNGTTAVFVSKLDVVGSSVVYTAYLSGSGMDTSAGLAVDSAGDAYVTGTTTSTNFPVTTSAFQPAPRTNGVAHVFLAKLDPTGGLGNGGKLLYSSYLSGSMTDNAMALAADNTGHAYILGNTFSTDFPVAGSPFQPTANGATHLFFVSKFDTTATGTASLLASSFLGGGTAAQPTANPPDGVVCAQLPCGGIALDTTGNMYVTGTTLFTNLAIANAYQSMINQGKNTTGTDAFVAKITNAGTGILYLTYLGGTANDSGNAIAVDTGGIAYVTGTTNSVDLIPGSLTTGLTQGFQTVNTGNPGAYVAKISNPISNQVALTYASYIGGSSATNAFGIVADSSQNVYVTGSTNSPAFPTLPFINGSGTSCAYTPLANGGTHAFLLKASTTLTTSVVQPCSSTSLLSAAILGGTTGSERGTSIAQNISGTVLVAGETNSTNFPAISKINGINPLQTSLQGPSDAFLADFGATTDLALAITVPSTGTVPNPVGLGNQEIFTYTITNKGPDSSTDATVVIPVIPTSAGVTATTFATSSGTCALSGNTETCVLGSLALNATAAITATVTPNLTTTTQLSMTGTVFPGIAGGIAAVDPNLSNNTPPAPTVVPVDYFTLDVNPKSASVTAGQSLTFVASLSAVSANGSPQFPSSIALACTGLPTGATCAFKPSPVPNIPATSPVVTSTLVLSTTAPPKTGAIWKAPKFLYAMWLPISGLALLGAGSKRRRWISGLALLALLSAVGLWSGCGKSNSTTTGGTQPGIYTIGVTATSGTFVTPSPTTPLNLTVTVTAP